MLMVVLAEQGKKIESCDVVPKIGGNVTDAQAAAQRRIISMGLDRRLELARMARAPSAIFLGNGLGLAGGVEVQTENTIALKLGVVWLKFHRRSWQGIASSIRPAKASAKPRLVWARAKFGASSTAR